ncbi:B12-binding domain-containing radical SAM protein [Panacibacter ginsenosidivorans]|uniref:B12-binding domain-containing radical SAM protein n=1 Tax=Panacibacter ginsenosidivorans TaxID=1813871 RepID=A0A5B8V3R9_9BACT|nr:radical SAM protein [Panacibacter ginsenosidivorans]QEC66167.1 B12-binding domain-containing radical SAM protein [Panacibacter ginsenosidivorans]
MSAILFTHSYFLRFDPKQWKTGQPYAPLGTLYAAAVMRQEGYSVSLFDTMFAHNAAEVIPYIEKQQPEFFVIYDDGFNYLTKMCLTNMREAAFEMIAKAKQRGCTVIVSSSDSTDHFENYLTKGADFILIGEAELTLKELVHAIENNVTDFSGIQGLAYKHNDHVVKTVKRSVIKELDDLPIPAWDIVDITPYREMWMQHAGYFSMNMGTTRGCPFKCNWCAKPIYGNRYNSRSPENVIAELKMLKEKYQYDHIWFCDDIFGLKPGWVNRFADLVEKENLQLKFKIQARADLLLQENYIKDLARAGCDMIWMGAESGSQKILDAMDKGTTVEQIYTATKLIKKHGMKPCFFIQFGYPGETKEDIASTINMINTLLPYDMGISVSYPLPGTKFFENVQSQLKEKANWTDSDELMLMFHNTYKPEYYKKLHRYVHKNYRKHKAMQQAKDLLRKPGTLTLQTLKKALSFMYYTPATFIDERRLNKLAKE